MEEEEESRWDMDEREEEEKRSKASEPPCGGEEAPSGAGCISFFFCSSSSRPVPAQNECLLRGPGDLWRGRGNVNELSTSLWWELQQGVDVCGRECLSEERGSS